MRPAIIFLIITLSDVVPSAAGGEWHVDSALRPAAIWSAEEATGQTEPQTTTNPTKTETAPQPDSPEDKGKDKKPVVEQVSGQMSAVRSITIDFLLLLLLIAFVAAGVREFRRKS